MKTAVFIVCGKDFADDKTKLNTEIPLQSLESTVGKFTEQNRTEQNRIEKNRIEWNRIE